MTELAEILASANVPEVVLLAGKSATLAFANSSVVSFRSRPIDLRNLSRVKYYSGLSKILSTRYFSAPLKSNCLTNSRISLLIVTTSLKEL